MARSLISFVAICLLLSPLGEARSRGGAHAGMSAGAPHAACCADPEQCRNICDTCVTGCALVLAASDIRRDSSPRDTASSHDYRANSRLSWTDPPAGEPPK